MFCYSTGAVTGIDEIGGLVGLNEHSVTNCYSTGAVNGENTAGGLVGRNGRLGRGGIYGQDYYGTILNCYSTGWVSGGGDTGGLVGNNTLGLVDASFWDTQTSGHTTSDSRAGLTTAEMQTAFTFLEAGWDFVDETENGPNDVWKIVEGQTYPLLSWQKYGGGTGEPNDPYLIYTAEHLNALGAEPNDYDKHFKLMADIDLSGYVYDRAVIAADMNDANWDFDGIPFTGVFDGNGHVVAQLSIMGASYLGLFGQLDSGADISNVSLEVVDVNGTGSHVGGLVGNNGVLLHAGGIVSGCYVSGAIKGQGDVGGVAGGNFGTITSTHNAATVIGVANVGGLVGRSGDDHYGLALINHCYSTGSIRGALCVGGLVGGNSVHSSITECCATGAVNGTGGGVGGLVGLNTGFVAYCYSAGAVSSGGEGVGGLVGSSWDGSWIEYSYSMSDVTGGIRVGGLVGEHLADDCDDRDHPIAVVFSCYSVGTVCGEGALGGLIGCVDEEGGWEGYLAEVSQSFWDFERSGLTESGGGTGLTTAEMQDPGTFMAVGWDFVGQPDGPHDIWVEPEGGGYPVLWWQLSPDHGLPHFSGGTGEPNDPYLISTPQDLNAIGHNPRLMKRHFRLTNDVDLSGVFFYPIGDTYSYYPIGDSYCFEGSFDGKGHTVSHLTIQDDDYLGLFRYLAPGATVKNLGVVDANVTATSVYADVGALAGANAGTVSNCYSTGTVTSDRAAVGGLLGSNSGLVTCCYSTVMVASQGGGGGLVGSNRGSIITSCSTGAVCGDYDYVGGLVGNNAYGSVRDCYSTSTVEGRSYVGGLMGSNAAGNVRNCYSTGTVQGGSHVGGLVGSNIGSPYYRPPHGTVAGSFWDVQTSGLSVSAGGTGKTTAEMQTGSTFLDAGWDFVEETENGTDDIWWILEGQDYPRLWWELEN